MIELLNLFSITILGMVTLGFTAGVIFVWINLVVWIYRGCRYGF